MHRTCLIALLLIMTMPTLIPQASATGSFIFEVSKSSTESLSSSPTEWWKIDWRYRIGVTVANPTSMSRVNEIIFMYVDIPKGRCLSGFRELRVIDEQEGEVPSAVVYELFQDGFTRGAFLTFLANFTAMETRTFHIYYGNPTATPPSYRASQPITSIDNNIIKIDLNETNVNLGYRKESYTYVYTSKVQYNNSTQHDYGSISVAHNPLKLLSDWESSFNVAGTRINATSSIYKAGDLKLVKLFLLQSNQLWIFDILINENSNLLDNVVYIDFFDAVAMSMRGLVYGGFNSDDKVLFAEVGGTFIGLKSNLNPNAYDIGFWRTVYNRTRNVELGMASEGYGDLALALQWNLGKLRQYEHKTLARLFTVGANYAELRESLNRVATRPQINISNEEALESLIPSAAIVATDEIQMTNLTVPSQGFTTFYKLSEAGWTINSAWIKGDVVYGLPNKGDYDFEKPTIWSVNRYTGSDCIAFPTDHTWSEGRKSYVGAVRLWDNSTNDYAWGNVTSRFIRVIRASRTLFSFQYRAKHHSDKGTLPRLYIALMVDVDFDEVSDRILTFPLQETFIGLNETKVSELIGDYLWHSVRVDITNFVAAKDFQFSIKLHGETLGYDGSEMNYRGLLEMDIDDVFVEVNGACPDVFDVKTDPFSNSLTVIYSHPGLNVPVLFCAADATLYCQVIKSTPTVSVEPKGTLKAVFPAEERRSLTLTKHAAVIHGVRGAFLKAVYLNDALLREDHYDLEGPCLIINKEAFLSALGTDKLTTFELHLSNTYHTLTLHVQDDNRKTLSNASITVEDNFGRRVTQSTTDTTGKATLDLIPFTYVINMAYHGINLDSKRIELKEDSELTSSCRVYEQRFRVFNMLNQLVKGAEVRLMKDGAVVARELTNEDGSTTFKLVALSVYTVQVFIEGTLYSQSEFKVTVNNVTVDLRTSFAPTWFIIAILISLTAVIAVVLLLAKYTGKIFETLKHKFQQKRKNLSGK